MIKYNSGYYKNLDSLIIDAALKGRIVFSKVPDFIRIGDLNIMCHINGEWVLRCGGYYGPGKTNIYDIKIGRIASLALSICRTIKQLDKQQ